MSGQSLRTKSMIVRAIGAYVLFAHTQDAPLDDEWDDGLEFFKTAPDPAATRTLVYTAGGAPSAAQRARLKVALGSRKLPMAVLTPSALARAAGAAISWFNPQFRVFGADDVDLALDHLGVSGNDRDLLRQTLREMRAELSLLTRRAG